MALDDESWEHCKACGAAFPTGGKCLNDTWHIRQVVELFEALAKTEAEHRAGPDGPGYCEVCSLWPHKGDEGEPQLEYAMRTGKIHRDDCLWVLARKIHDTRQ